MHVVIQVLPALERPPASCVWPALCWEPRWRTPCWSWTPPTTGEAPLRTTSGCLVDWELTVSILSAGASTWWGTRSRCLLSRRSHCPKDGTRSSFWTKPTGKQAVQWLFKNKEIPILRLKLQGNKVMFTLSFCLLVPVFVKAPENMLCSHESHRTSQASVALHCTQRRKSTVL